MRPRIYGSTDIQVFRTRTSPDPRGCSSTSAISKFEWVEVPFGRLTNRTSRDRSFILQVSISSQKCDLAYSMHSVAKSFNPLREGYEKMSVGAAERVLLGRSGAHLQ